ncbi:MAG TPA: polysaccharide lyase [Hyalangium sp.]|nr:polysaccharide lyase [Hyalangium sp.]HYI03018.1 polysaccharide lyase [Hyalangium sp.]
MLGVSSPARAGVLWRGDFETGDRSQYSAAHMVSADRLQVVTSPVAEGSYALKATVKQGDDPINASGHRSELVYLSNEAEGSEYYYRWKVMFPADYPSVRTWQLFTQWHHDGCCGSPPVEFYVYGEEIRLRVNQGADVWTTPLVRGVWHELTFHVKWSSDPSVGFVELWHNRERAVPKRNLATMYAGTKNYLKLGLYRNDTVTPVGVVYHDGFIQATQLADVLPAPAPAPDAGTPDAGTPGPSPALDAGTSIPGAVEPVPLGCSAAGSPLMTVALLALLGGLRLRRRR